MLLVVVVVPQFVVVVVITLGVAGELLFAMFYQLF